MIFPQGQSLDTGRGKTVASEWQERGKIAILEVNVNE